MSAPDWPEYPGDEEPEGGLHIGDRVYQADWTFHTQGQVLASSLVRNIDSLSVEFQETNIILVHLGNYFWSSVSIVSFPFKRANNWLSTRMVNPCTASQQGKLL